MSKILDGKNIYLIDNLYNLIFNNSYINSQLPIPKKLTISFCEIIQAGSNKLLYPYLS